MSYGAEEDAERNWNEQSKPKGVPLLELTPGGGKVESFVYVSPDAYISPRSAGLDNAEIRNKARVTDGSIVSGFGKVLDHAELISSMVTEHARVSGRARLENAHLAGTAEVYGEVLISNSILTDNVIVCGEASVTDSVLRGNVRIDGRATVFNLDTNNFSLADTIEIGGSAHLDFEKREQIEPGARILEGYWTRPPHVIHTYPFTSTESVNDLMYIGCIRHSCNKWLRDGHLILVEYGWSMEHYDQFREAVIEMQKFKKENPSPKRRKRK